MSAPDQATLHAACTELGTRDQALARAYEETGLPTWRAMPPAYATLARIIVFQQISTAAGSSIWGKVEALLPGVEAPALLAATDEALRGCGLSRPKIGHLRAIAEAVASGQLDLAALCTQPIEAARADLVAIRGIGPWTADIFLLNAAGHVDAFPAADLGLIESYRRLSEAEDRMSAKAFAEQADAWRPYRGVAAHLLWDWINAMRDHAKNTS